MQKKKLAAGTKDTKRDWGKGFACTGRSKECTKVDKNHFGPIPGIEVGMSWMFRMQICEQGLHRPPVAGIAGTAALGCPSLILSGGYEDDEDNGDMFTYTGAGGTGGRRKKLWIIEFQTRSTCISLSSLIASSSARTAILSASSASSSSLL